VQELRGKLLEAMQCGTPNITTSIGAESMHGDLSWNGFADNSAVLQMKRYIKMKDFGFSSKKVDIINHRYLRGLFEDDFMEDKNYKLIYKNRLNNFMGSLQHTLKSTKYMSCGLKLRIKYRVFFVVGVFA
jgi:hypothetical protein